MRENFRGATLSSLFTMLLQGGLINIIGALMSVLAISFSQDVTSIGFLVSIKSFGTILTLGIGGVLSDKLGRRKLMIIGILLFMVFLTGMIVTTNYLYAIIFCLIGGIAQGFTDTSGFSLIFDIFPEDSGSIGTFTQVFFGGGGMITSFLASVLISRNLSYKYLFGFYLIIAVVTLLFTAFSKFPVLRSHVENVVETKFSKEPKVLKEGFFTGVLAFIFAIPNYCFMTWIPYFIYSTKSITDADSVQILTAFMTGSVLGSLFFTIILRKNHPTKVMSITPFLGSLIALLMIILDGFLLLLVIGFMLGFIIGNMFPMCLSMGGELFPKKSGMMTGFIGTLSMIGGIVSVALSTEVIEIFGIENVMWLGFGFLILLGILNLLYRNMYKNLIKI